MSKVDSNIGKATSEKVETNWRQSRDKLETGRVATGYTILFKANNPPWWH